MKKKIISILAALVICLSPIMFLAGCTTVEDTTTTINTNAKWSVVEGGSFASMTISGVGTSDTDYFIKYYAPDYNSPKKDDDGKIIGYKDKEVLIKTFADAIENGLRVVEGFDSSKITADNSATRKMKVIFNGKIFEVTYTVTAAETTTEGNQNNQGGTGTTTEGNQNNQGGTGTT